MRRNRAANKGQQTGCGAIAAAEAVASRQPRGWVRAGLVTALAIAAGGCGTEAPGAAAKACAVQGDCPAGQSCRPDGTCAVWFDCAATVCPHQPCEKAICDPSSGCSVAPLAVGTPCGPDLCAKACDDKGGCTADRLVDCKAAQCEKSACDPATGKCKTTTLADGAGCDDGDLCTAPDQCVSGACGGAVETCDDGQPCTTDACEPKSGCTHVAAKGPCDDGQACTLDDSCSTGKCQGTPSVFFAGAWGDAGSDEGYGLAVLPDGFALVGYSESALGDPDGRLLRVGPHGALLWDKTFGGEGLDLLFDVLPVSGGGFALVGSTDSIGTGLDDAWLVLTDKDGALLVEKTLGGAAADVAEAIVAGPGGALVVAGRTASKGAGGSDGWLVTLDASGKQLSDRVYGGKEDDGFAHLLALEGGYLAVGRTASAGLGGDDAWVVRTGPSGAPVWDKAFGAAKKDEALSAATTSDGGFVVVGRTASMGAGGDDGLLLRLSGTGDLLWQRTFGAEGHDVLSAVQPHGQGHVLFGTRYAPQDKVRQAWLLRVDAGGVLRFERTLGGGISDFGHAVAVLAAPPVKGASMPDGVGGLVLAGAGRFEGKQDQFTLMRTDDWGNATCASSGVCSSQAAGHCDDGNPCTLDACKDGLCGTNTLPDGAPCGTGLSCSAGSCG